MCGKATGKGAPSLPPLLLCLPATSKGFSLSPAPQSLSWDLSSTELVTGESPHSHKTLIQVVQQCRVKPAPQQLTQLCIRLPDSCWVTAYSWRAGCQALHTHWAPGWLLLHSQPRIFTDGSQRGPPPGFGLCKALHQRGPGGYTGLGLRISTSSCRNPLARQQKSKHLSASACRESLPPSVGPQHKALSHFPTLT